jgi:hypothetical protein
MDLRIVHETKGVIRVIDKDDDNVCIIVHRTKDRDPYGEDRTTYAYSIRVPFKTGTITETGRDLRTGVGNVRTARETLGSLLSFLGAAAESYAHTIGKYRGWPEDKGENGDLFSEHIVEWAHQNSDELAMLQSDIEPDDE